MCQWNGIVRSRYYISVVLIKTYIPGLSSQKAVIDCKAFYRGLKYTMVLNSDEIVFHNSDTTSIQESNATILYYFFHVSISLSQTSFFLIRSGKILTFAIATSHIYTFLKNWYKCPS